MKKFILLFLAVIGSINQLQAQEQVIGAWKLSEGDSQHQLYFQNGFFFHTVYKGNQFVMTRGGSFTANGNSLNVLILFNSADTAEVHQRRSIPFGIEKNLLSLKMGEAINKFERIDNGKAPLSGVWHITGRMGEDGKIAAIHQTGTRQTYKLLTGTKFQWVAIDPGKKQFSGTGGGTYTFKDGKYTENIEFFSRDHTRVGASLAFDGRLEDGKWHHSGLSSKGAKIYEVWSKVAAEIPSKP
ncbi:MAG: membrane or secreted protein [Bacteroidia bacterium]